MGAGLKKDLRVSRVGPLNAFFFFSSELFHKDLPWKKGGTSTLGERSTTESCMLRLGRMNRSRKGIYLFSPNWFGWTLGSMIYFMGEVSGSSPGWPSCAKEKNRRSI
ncbi:hypothetical protein CFOL_v3_19512 [Cephalotus follicularis]|uniref:Uncharacterized protein n=1 Tax=Cephalotus follicularis TaxID=3775 RepID=A0A1Q3C6Y9_CEPFO|nr:hypothetical protein CFOL_v3_19512 [Cephalotus follicularis]